MELMHIGAGDQKGLNVAHVVQVDNLRQKIFVSYNKKKTWINYEAPIHRRIRFIPFGIRVFVVK